MMMMIPGPDVESSLNGQTLDNMLFSLYTIHSPARYNIGDEDGIQSIVKVLCIIITVDFMCYNSQTSGITVQT
jgi:hypothetical protein